MYKNKITQALLLGAGLAVATTSFTSFAANVPAGTKLAPVQELVRGNGTEVASLDPHKTEGVPESNVIRDLLEGLVNQDANGNVVPGVAESWETTDNKTFTFPIFVKMRNGLTVTLLLHTISSTASNVLSILQPLLLTLGIWNTPR
ncbi:oligopeptide ABC transporter, periplasmic oligopeptide-binding protein [Vibrio cholerae]|nr:oligopeptide ABC transporter, periplasmic oligopeptide-binding protein [Vibrio cholerae]